MRLAAVSLSANRHARTTLPDVRPPTNALACLHTHTIIYVGVCVYIYSSNVKLFRKRPDGSWRRILCVNESIQKLKAVDKSVYIEEKQELDGKVYWGQLDKLRIDKGKENKRLDGWEVEKGGVVWSVSEIWELEVKTWGMLETNEGGASSVLPTSVNIMERGRRTDFLIQPHHVKHNLQLLFPLCRTQSKKQMSSSHQTTLNIFKWKR